MVKNMRLIDADALKKAIPETTVDASTKYRYCVTFEREDVLAIIDAAPTIEIDRPTRSQFKRMAVQLGYEPVVHCRECKHYRNHPNGLCYSHTEPCDNERGYKGEAICVEPEDFCSYGKRRTDFVDDNKIGERRADV